MSKYFNVEEKEQELKDFATFLKPYEGQKGSLMMALHHAQDTFGFIAPEIQQLIAEKLKVPMADVYGVVTFYSRFTEIPKGKKEYCVCMGTACYVKGAVKVLEELEKATGLKAGETSEDGEISISTTRCLGACGMAPVMTVGDEVHGRLKPKDVLDLLSFLKQDPLAKKEAEDFLAKEGMKAETEKGVN